MWYIATDDGVIQTRDYEIDDGAIYIEREDFMAAISSSVIAGKTTTCPEEILPLTLSAAGIENLIEITIPWERVRFFVNVEDTEPEPEEEKSE